jgi:hypothetical protein
MRAPRTKSAPVAMGTVVLVLTWWVLSRWPRQESNRRPAPSSEFWEGIRASTASSACSIRVSTRAFVRIVRIVRKASGEIGVVKIEAPTIREAVAKFFEDCEARKLGWETMRKYRHLLEDRFISWSERKGLKSNSPGW